MKMSKKMTLFASMMVLTLATGGCVNDELPTDPSATASKALALTEDEEDPPLRQWIETTPCEAVKTVLTYGKGSQADGYSANLEGDRKRLLGIRLVLIPTDLTTKKPSYGYEAVPINSMEMYDIQRYAIAEGVCVRNSDPIPLFDRRDWRSERSTLDTTKAFKLGSSRIIKLDSLNGIPGIRRWTPPTGYWYGLYISPLIGLQY